MNIYFLGNSFKYECEAVIKLFFPLERFGFFFDEDIAEEGDRIILSTVGKIAVSIECGELSASKESVLPESEDETEGALCRTLFLMLSEVTGCTPEWGCLTGIRPVKKINELTAQGLDRHQRFEHLKEMYFLTPKKFELCEMTADRQHTALETLDEKNSFSLYVSIPFCPSRCSYCSFVSHSITSRGAKELIGPYVKKLCEEIARTAQKAADMGLFCDTVYIGGGTPTAISAKHLDNIIKTLYNSFDLSKIREFTVEAGRPDTITEEKLAVIKENGATRISINPQTLSDEVLKNIGRIHTTEEFFRAFELARSMGFNNINTDTIAGLTGDTVEGFGSTIEQLIGLSPESITVHTLTVKRSARLFASENRQGLAGTADVARMVDTAFTRLTESGYSPYYLYRQKNTVGNLENVGYCKKGKESLYNIYIMEERQNILAVGAGASTKFIDPATGKITRQFNYKYPYEYINRPRP